MQNYYLKFKDQAELETTLISLGLAEIYDEQFIPKTNLDVIGLIYKPTGLMITTEDGMKYPEMLPLEGWHANLKDALTLEQEVALPLIATPNAPYRKWAGE
jgi:hypothetical protein